MKKFLILISILLLPPVTRADSTIRPSDGAMVVDGSPFFPIGFYYVTYDARHDTQRLADLAVLAEAGFNTVVTALAPQSADAFLDAAKQRKVRVIVESNHPNGPLETVRALKAHPALLGWMIFDDVDNGKKTPELVRQRHAETRAADPSHLTYISGAYAKRIAAYAGTADILAMQTYPVPDEPLVVASQAISAAVSAAAPLARSVVANNQAFAWRGQRPPTPLEVRNMTYQSLIEGAKGIIYYTWFDDTWNLMEHPELLREFRTLATELREFGNIVLHAERRAAVVAKSEAVRAAIWTRDAQTTVAVCNTSAETAHNFSIKLPLGIVGAAHPFFAERPADGKVRDGRLVGVVAPGEVQIYAIEARR